MIQLKDMTVEERLSFMENKIDLLEQEQERLLKYIDEMQFDHQKQIDSLINYTMELRTYWEFPTNDVC